MEIILTIRSVETKSRRAEYEGQGVGVGASLVKHFCGNQKRRGHGVIAQRTPPKLQKFFLRFCPVSPALW